MTWTQEIEQAETERYAQQPQGERPEPATVRERHFRRKQRGASGLFSRRSGKRLSVEQLVSRASLLPDVGRALISAYYDLKMPIDELAALHHMRPGQLRRRLEHWRDTLSDPAFLLVAEFGQQLPPALAQLARDYWIEGMTMRELAAAHAITLHAVRNQLHETRSLLLVAMSRRQEVPAELARGILEGRRKIATA